MDHGVERVRQSAPARANGVVQPARRGASPNTATSAGVPAGRGIRSSRVNAARTGFPVRAARGAVCPGAPRLGRRAVPRSGWLAPGGVRLVHDDRDPQCGPRAAPRTTRALRRRRRGRGPAHEGTPARRPTTLSRSHHVLDRRRRRRPKAREADRSRNPLPGRPGPSIPLGSAQQRIGGGPGAAPGRPRSPATSRRRRAGSNVPRFDLRRSDDAWAGGSVHDADAGPVGAMFDSMPTPNIVTMSDDPPTDRNGADPDTGDRPMTAPRLITACPTIQQSCRLAITCRTGRERAGRSAGRRDRVRRTT